MVNDYDKNYDNDKADCQPISWSVVNMFAMKRIMTIVNPAAGIHDLPLNLLLPRSQKCNPCFVSTNLLSQSVAAHFNLFLKPPIIQGAFQLDGLTFFGDLQ